VTWAPWVIFATPPWASYSYVTGASAPAAAGSPACWLIGRPRASKVVVV
jgi:hypothetical protein